MSTFAMGELMLLTDNLEIEAKKDDSIFDKACQWMTQEKDPQIQVQMIRIFHFFSVNLPQFADKVVENGMIPFIVPLIKKEMISFPAISETPQGKKYR